MKVWFVDVEISHFIGGLEYKLRARVSKSILMLRVYGAEIRGPHSKSLGNGLFELRVQGSNAVRLIFAFHKGEAVILNAFSKKSQKLPSHELRKAFEKYRYLQ